MGANNPAIAVGFALVLLVAGGFVVAYGMGQHGDESRIAANGVHATGTVYNLADNMGRAGQGRQVRRALDVSFQAGGAIHQHRFDVTPSAFAGHRVGSSVDLIYERSDPDQAILADSSLADQTGMQFVLVGALFIAGGLALTGGAIYLWRSKRDEAPDLDEALAKARRQAP